MQFCFASRHNRHIRARARSRALCRTICRISNKQLNPTRQTIHIVLADFQSLAPHIAELFLLMARGINLGEPDKLCYRTSEYGQDLKRVGRVGKGLEESMPKTRVGESHRVQVGILLSRSFK